MNIEDLAEFQGLTAEAVRAHMLATGWTQRPSATGVRWLSPDGLVNSGESDTAYLLARVADTEKRTVQSLLRSINPRMREGWPSEAAVTEHEKLGGRWMVCSPSGVLMFGSFDERMGVRCFDVDDWVYEQREMEGWRFWPCDEHGNKVMWPTKDGVML